MITEDLKKFHLHLSIALSMLEFNNLIEMSEIEKRNFETKFKEADMVIGHFIIRMIQIDSKTVIHSSENIEKE